MEARRRGDEAVDASDDDDGPCLPRVVGGSPVPSSSAIDRDRRRLSYEKGK